MHIHARHTMGIFLLKRPAICPPNGIFSSRSRTVNPVTELHSPNNRRTLLRTLSFSGSYGWSLLGISSTAGKGSAKVSTLWRMRSAIWNSGYMCQTGACEHQEEEVFSKTHVLIDQEHGDIFPFVGKALECALDLRCFGLGVYD